MIELIYVVLFCSIVSVIILIMCCTMLFSRLKLSEGAQEIVIIIHPNCEVCLGQRLVKTAVRGSNHRSYTI